MVAAKIKKRVSVKTVYHAISVTLVVASLLFSVFRFSGVAMRVVQSFRDFFVSIAYYFTEIFGFEGLVTATVVEIPDDITSILPIEWSEFKMRMQMVGQLLVNGTNAGNYFREVGRVVGRVAQVILVLLLPMLLIGVVISMMYKTENNDYNQDTRPLEKWKRMENAIYYPVKRFISDFISFLKSNGKYLAILCFIWLYNLNVITIIVEFVAYVFYFSVAPLGDWKLYTQLVKLAIDLTVPLAALPMWAKLLLAWIIFDYIRKSYGNKRLKKCEERDRQFLDDHPGALFVTGKQRAKKTTIITDMSLSQSAMFREKAKEKLQDRDMQFPHFSWICVENSVKYGIAHKTLPTLARVREYIRYLKRCFYGTWANSTRKHIIRNLKEKYGYPSNDFIFGYDYQKYGMVYNDNLTIINIFEAIEKYAQLYFIYAAPTPLICANYSIRTDTKRDDVGNFPIFEDDFFKSDPVDVSAGKTEYCHKLDYDSMRLGKVFDNNNPFKDGFEVGVATEMEHAKERGNQYTKTGNRGDIECNQWNDLFELDVKMHGHAATVDNYTFFRMLLDDQRPDSLSADNRDLCDIVMIKDVSDPKIVMPFFAIGEATYLGATKIFNKIYYYVRHNRGDNTLLVYLLKKIYAPIKNHYVRIFNRYSVYVATLRVSDAMTDERLTDRGKYYVSTKKVYSNRFATDAINEFYHRKNLRSKNGLNDFPAYTDLHPTCDDLKDIHSHFYKQILQTFDIENAMVAERKNIAEKISIKHTKNTK